MNDDVADVYLGAAVDLSSWRVPPPPEPPFKVGDRVRMKPTVRPTYTKVSRTGAVIRVQWTPSTWRPGGGWWEVYVRKDNRKVARWVSQDEWELDDGIRPFSEAAVALAKAVLAGDVGAAWALADEVFEHAKPSTVSGGDS